jgi:hypothetical protein
MEINVNPGRIPDPGAGQPITRKETAPPVTDAPSFEHSRNLERALQEVPLTRPEKVAHARAVLSDVKYPPNALLDSIANLLATHLNKE